MVSEGCSGWRSRPHLARIARSTSTTSPIRREILSSLECAWPDNPDEADASSEEIILRVAQPYANHNGGNLVFGPDGYLYVGLGDGGSAGDPQNNAQRPDALLGKMLRIRVEPGQSTYGVPSDNPFVNNNSYRPEIWATGLRNPWRYSFDRETKDLWIADVGQGRAEEVNFQPAASKGGENYGWRRTEGLECYPPGSTCDRTGATLPILEYGRTLGQSVTGGFVYRGSRYPDLRGFYLYGDFGSGNLWAVQRQGSSWDNRLVLATGRQISTFGEDETGELYLADYRGDIYLIVAGQPVTSTGGVVNAASFGPGLSPGSLGTVFGRGLTALPGIVQAGLFPIPTELAGTSVKLNGIAAPVIAVANVDGQEQINFQAPYELAGAQSATLIVTANGRASSPVEVLDHERSARDLRSHPKQPPTSRFGQRRLVQYPMRRQPGIGAPLSPLATVDIAAIGHYRWRIRRPSVLRVLLRVSLDSTRSTRHCRPERSRALPCCFSRERPQASRSICPSCYHQRYRLIYHFQCGNISSHLGVPAIVPWDVLADRFAPAETLRTGRTRSRCRRNPRPR